MKPQHAVVIVSWQPQRDLRSSLLERLEAATKKRAQSTLATCANEFVRLGVKP